MLTSLQDAFGYRVEFSSSPQSLVVKQQSPIDWGAILSHPSLEQLTFEHCNVDTLEPLHYLSELQQLRIESTGVSKEVLASSLPCFHVTKLSLDSTPITKVFWSEWIRLFPGMKELSIASRYVEWENFAMLQEHSSLLSFSLDGWGLSDDAVTVERLAWLASLPQLKALELKHLKLGEGCLAWICRLPLRSLSLDGCTFAIEDLKELSQLKSLEKLKLILGWDMEGKIQEQESYWDLATLPMLPHLQHLSLSGELFQPGAVSQIVACQGLHSLELACTEMEDGAIEELGKLPNLQCLTLDERELTDLSLVALATFPALKVLALPSTSISDEFLYELNALASLECLDLTRTRTDGPGLTSLLKHPSLRYLVCDFKERGSGAYFAFLRDWLEDPTRSCLFRDELLQDSLPSSLEFDDFTFVPEAWKGLAGWTSLQKLTLYEVDWEDSSDIAWEEACSESSFPELQELTFRETEPPPILLSHLASFPKLRTLCMEETKLRVEDFSFLEQLPKLEKVEIFNVEFAPEAVTHFPLLPVLRELSLVRSPSYSRREPSMVWSAELLEPISLLPSLEKLTLSSSKLRKDSFSVLSKLSSLRSLDLSYGDVEEGDWTALAFLSHLEELDLGSSSISNEGFQCLPSFTKLTSLSLNDTNVEDEGLQVLQQLHQLEKLDLFGCSVSEAILQSLVELSNLKYLDISWSSINDDIAPIFTSFPELEYLGLAGVQELTHVGLASIVTCKKLDTMNLAKAWFGGEGIGALGSLPRLFTVYFYHGFSVSDGESYREFQASAPYCSVIW